MPTLALSPQLLSRASEPPDGDGWIHEIKYDGYRLLASVEHGRASLRSRPGADWTSRLPLIAKAVASLDASSVTLDGELVYLREDGFPDFERLQGATRAKDANARLYYQVFDLLALHGTDLTCRPLLERKARLRELLTRVDNPRLRYVAHVDSDGGAFFRAVDEMGLEGIVCKRGRSIYRPGIRSADWVKVKCFRTQRFLIVGYTLLDGRLESLSLAGEHGGQLHYAGRVEWGVPRRDDGLLRTLHAIAEPTVCLPQIPSRGVTLVEPRLTAEVRALSWQVGRTLRHAVFRGASLVAQR